MIVSGAATQQKPFQLSEARGSDLLQRPGSDLLYWGEVQESRHQSNKLVSASNNIFFVTLLSVSWIYFS